jgi:hypothetical protein
VILSVGSIFANKSNEIPYSFYIETIGRAKMHLKTKNTEKQIKVWQHWKLL